MRGKKIFCIYGCFTLYAYHLCQHWQSSGILIFLHKYCIVISDAMVYSLLDALFLLLSVILSELHEEPRRKDWVTEKKYIEEFVWGISLFWLLALLSMYFCWFLCLLPPTFQVTCLRNGPYKDIHIAMGGILCDDIVRKRSKIGKSPTIYIWTLLL